MKLIALLLLFLASSGCATGRIIATDYCRQQCFQQQNRSYEGQQDCLKRCEESQPH